MRVISHTAPTTVPPLVGGDHVLISLEQVIPLLTGDERHVGSPHFLLYFPPTFPVRLQSVHPV